MIPHRLADNTDARSIATRLRRQRFQILVDLLADLPPPVTILDLGGRQQYWELMAAGSSLLDRLQVTLLNTEPVAVSLPSFVAVAGDARAMPQFADRQFDIAFSNSTIEHVGTLADQGRMAGEVIRLGRRYCVQTPNRGFPIEPHTLFPLFQFLPVTARLWLVRHFALGWLARMPDRGTAWREVSAIRLLTRSELARLFPGAAIHEERICGLVKSFVAYTPRGAPNAL